MDADLEALIRRAFEMAKLSGKPDWDRMTTAVFKNRLLQLTGGTFDEKTHGARSVSDLVEKAAPLLALDRSQNPAIVEFRTHTAEGVTSTGPSETTKSPGARRGRVRRDLWWAVMDYSSGKRYVWDASQGIARPAADDETTALTMPTMTAREMADWRSEFVKKLGGEGAAESMKARLNEWQSKGLPSGALPPMFLGAWNRELKQRVEERLVAWFKAQGVQPPADMTEIPPPTATSDETRLRDLIVECVKMMTPNELRQLTLPASVLERLKLRRE